MRNLLILLFLVLNSFKSYAKKETSMIRVSGSTQAFLFQPTKLKSYQQYSFIHLFLEPLINISKTGLIEGGVASSWEIKEHGKKYVFNIDKNAKFHDGKKITSMDVAFSLCQHLDPELDSLLKVYLETILENSIYNKKSKICKSIRSVDIDTLELSLKGPYPPLLSDLAQPGFGIIPRDFKELNPIGSGPYKLDSMSENNFIKLALSKDYWRDLPKNKVFTFEIIREKQDILKAFFENRIDVSLGAPIDLVEGGRPSDIDFQYINGMVSTNMYINGKSSIFENTNLRKDFNQLMNIFRKNKDLYTRYDIPIFSYLPNGIMPSFYYKRDIIDLSIKDFKKKHKHIINKKVKIIIPKHIFTDRFLSKFKEAISEIGFIATYIEEKGKAYLDPIEQGGFDLVFIPFMGIGSDPDGYLAMLDPNGFLKKSNIQTNDLINKLAKIRFNENQEYRLNEYGKALKEFEETSIVIPIVQQHLPFLFRKGIQVPDFNFNNHTILRDFFWNK